MFVLEDVPVHSDLELLPETRGAFDTRSDVDKPDAQHCLHVYLEQKPAVLTTSTLDPSHVQIMCLIWTGFIQNNSVFMHCSTLFFALRKHSKYTLKCLFYCTLYVFVYRFQLQSISLNSFFSLHCKK